MDECIEQHSASLFTQLTYGANQISDWIRKGIGIIHQINPNGEQASQESRGPRWGWYFAKLCGLIDCFTFSF